MQRSGPPASRQRRRQRRQQIRMDSAEHRPSAPATAAGRYFLNIQIKSPRLVAVVRPLGAPPQPPAHDVRKPITGAENSYDQDAARRALPISEGGRHVDAPAPCRARPWRTERWRQQQERQCTAPVRSRAQQELARRTPALQAERASRLGRAGRRRRASSMGAYGEAPHKLGVFLQAGADQHKVRSCQRRYAGAHAGRPSR